MAGEGMTKDDKNRAIAEWLGYTKALYGRWHIPECKHPVRDGSCCEFVADLPNFFASEEASALALIESEKR